MVSLLCLLQHSHILIQHRLLREGYSIDAGKHLVLLISSPICAGNGGELYCLYHRGIGKMRTTAKVCKTAVCVEGDGAIRKVLDKLALILLSKAAESLHCFCLWHISSYKTLLAPCKGYHLILYLLKVCLRYSSLSKIHIIVKTILYSRAYSKLYARVELLQSFCHKV